MGHLFYGLIYVALRDSCYCLGNVFKHVFVRTERYSSILEIHALSFSRRSKVVY